MLNRAMQFLELRIREVANSVADLLAAVVVYVEQQERVRRVPLQGDGEASRDSRRVWGTTARVPCR
jgi:hypothetical protein